MKFFRRIRQKLIQERKIQKYLLYAIGEIFLVVVGILLAIQANQWKQNIIQEKLEVKLLTEVQAGVQSDKTDVDVNLYGSGGHMQIYHCQDTCIAWLNGEIQDITTESLTFNFSRAFRVSTFMITSSPFDALKEFGLNNLSNDSLKKEIQFLYDVMYPEYKRSLNMYYSIHEYTLNKGENYFKDFSFWGSAVEPHNIEVLKKDQAFLFALSKFKSYNEGLIRYNMDMLKRQKKILNLLEEELRGKS